MMTGQLLRPIGRSFILVVSLFIFLSGPLLSQSKKLRVTAETASIYLNPDEGSFVVATVKKGTIMTLRNARKFKRTWYQVLFLPEKSKTTKSGYIHDSSVEQLFVVTKIEILQDGKGMKKHFRQAQWEMTQNQVLRLEGNPVVKEKSDGLDVMRYKENVKEMDCWVEYIFKEDKLIKANYIFLVDHEYKSLYFGDYKKVKEFLTEIHEQSPLTNVNWMNPTHKEDYSKWGLAVSLGHLEYSAIWNLPETEIVLRLFGKNNKVNLIVDYTRILQEEKE
jgi:hypothetical protein